MKLINNIDDKKTVHFEELKVGDAYFDRSNVFCIKVDHKESLFFEPEYGWCAAPEYPSTIVRPLDVTITINGYLD